MELVDDGHVSIATVMGHACDSPRTADKADLVVLTDGGSVIPSLGELAIRYTVSNVMADL